MPQVFKIGPYLVYMWSNENNPLEPVHVHIAEGLPVSNATKIWITQTGHCIVANNNSQIPEHKLREMIKIIEANSLMIISKWKDHFGEATYYC